MKIKIQNIKKLNKVPSGSGIVKFGDGYYVIGDDSPYLFLLDKQFEVVSKTLISDDQNFNGDRIVKSEKADFETLELINENELLVFGSGSKSPQRDVFVRILLNDPMVIEKYNISEFYTHLKNLPVFNDSELNLEATAFYDQHLYLFNRRKNLIIKFGYQAFLSFIKGEGAFPKLDITEYSLPKINGIETGFSGATSFKKKPTILFTAAAEDTVNAYDDGEILGSIIGTIDISKNTISTIFDYCEIPNTGENFKVESVTIEQEIAVGKTQLVMITDDDKGNSTIIKSTLLW